MAASDSGDHKNLGTKLLTVDELASGGATQFTVGSAKVVVERFELKPVVNFLEYVFGGCSINLVVAVDFTGSNGQPSDPNSLHSRDPQRNQYLQAL